MSEHLPSWADLAQFLSLPLSLFIAWITVRLNTNDQRKLIVHQEVARSINDIINMSREVKDLTLEHLQGGKELVFSVGEARASKKQILNKLKSIEVARESLNPFLDKVQSNKMKDGMIEWKRGLTGGDRFPVERKQDVCKLGDQPLCLVESSYRDWECLCQSVKSSVLNNKPLSCRPTITP